jgi:DNA-binding IclR family transcriptional regulator
VPRTTPSIKRAFSILELFLVEQRSLSVREIIERVGLPRTTAHEIVNTLVESSYLRRDEIRSNKVYLGHKLLELGNAYAANFDLIAHGRRVAERIMADCDETVQMAILEGTDVVFIAKVESSKTVRLVSRVGSRLPAHCTAVGKMLLSRLTEEEVRALYNWKDELGKMTANSITSVSQLNRELEIIRQRGLSYDDCESNIDVRCVSAPVYDCNKNIVAAISISVPITRMSLTRQDELAEIIRKGADELSCSLGYCKQ